MDTEMKTNVTNKAKVNDAKSRSRKRSNKFKNKDKKSSQAQTGATQQNVDDMSVYYADPMLTATVANLSFGNRLGTSIGNYTDSRGSFQWTAPGIMSIKMAPSIGYANGPGDPINVAARRLFAVLTHGSGRTASYTPADVAQVTLAYAEILKMFVFARRTLQLAFTVNPLSGYEPDALLFMSGYNPDDIRKNLHAYIGELQALVTKANRLILPSNLNLFKQAWNQFSVVYSDTPDAMSQLYLTVPAMTWVYNENDGVPYLDAKTVYETPREISTMHKFSHLLSLITDMIDKLYASEACIAIMADVLHVIIDKNGGSAFTIPQFTVDSITIGAPRVYSDVFNLKLRNASVLGSPMGGVTALKVEQDASKAIVTFHPQWEARTPVLSVNKLISTEQGPLDPEGVVAATRYSVMDDKLSSGVGGYFTSGSIVLGDTLIIALDILRDTTLSSNSIVGLGTMQWSMPDHETSVLDFMQNVTAYANFTHAPIIPLMSCEYDTSVTPNKLLSWDSEGYMQDLGFYTTIQIDDIRRINTACLLSLFDFNYGVRK